MTTAGRLWNIYALRDPRDGRCRYVGATRATGQRLTYHASNARADKPEPKYAWLRELFALGLEPVCEVVDANIAPECRSGRERQWIEAFAEEGHPLLNERMMPLGVQAPSHRRRASAQPDLFAARPS